MAPADAAEDAALRGKTRLALGRFFEVTSRNAESQDALRATLDFARAAGDRRRRHHEPGAPAHEPGPVRGGPPQFETHLAEAERLLDFRAEHTPEDCGGSMLSNVCLHREIAAAAAQAGQ